MRFVAAALLSTVVLFQPALVQPAHAQEASAETQAAIKAADAWFAVADAGKYAESWTQAASSFRSMVTQERWIGAMRSARAPYGSVRSRKLARAHYTRKLPGAPEGEYVVIEYHTEFAGKAGVETVVPTREADGSWKVSGYFVK